ncbi:hypothetical protein KC19_N023900 [Ceratodon purpureus]|nr:hypothetical protein KC19_N023900 [Ceratodon purpureus]
MRPTGMREAFRQVKVDAKGFGKGVAKGLHRGTRHRHSDGETLRTLDVDVSLEERRDMYGFTVRPQHLERYLEYDKIYKAEEIHRSNRWEQFLDTYSNSSFSEGNEGGGAESAIEEKETCWGSLRAVEQALQYKHSGVENGDAIGVCPWAEELKKLVWEGVPVSLRGELWQIFTGAKKRWKDGFYQERLDTPLAETVTKTPRLEKWASQIEKDLPRTFPGHPVLEKDGLGSLRRMLTAYARHNPIVGYCQAMNFVAALLLLFMPEENAFWTLTSIIDVYFEGYYTEKMTEAQVDQLVFMELVREQLPKLARKLEILDVEISWFSGAWFLSIFVNVLPWECVLRVWDVLLFEGNRSMLFRTALALLEMHAESLLALNDSGDVLSMLQSMGETTFDSSQLVLSACLGFQEIDEERLQRLRSRHRRTVIAEMHKRSLDIRQWRTTNATAKQAIIDATNSSALVVPSTTADEERSVLEPQFSAQKRLINVEDEDSRTLELQFSAPKCLNDENDMEPHLNGLEGLNMADAEESGTLKYQLSAPKLFSYEPLVSNQNRFKSELYGRIDETDEFEDTEDSDLQVEVSKLRKELDHALQAREEAECRAEGLKHALTEMDQSRQSPAEMEELKSQVAHLKQALADKHEQEAATVEVLVRLEHENRKADEARRRAVEDAEENRRSSARALRRAADELEVMKKRALAAEIMLEALEKRAVLAESMLQAVEQQAADELRTMEKRAVMAESMLEATLDYHSGSSIPRTKRGVEPQMEPKLENTSEPKLERRLEPKLERRLEPKLERRLERKLEPRLKGDEANGNPRFHNHTTKQI